MTSILVVEDDPPLRTLLYDILTDEGYEVWVVNDGSAALQTLQVRYPTVILTDIMMPGMDGITLCERIQAQPTLAHIPIIMCSAGGMRPSRDRCRYVTYVEKPFMLPLLLDTIATIVQAST